MLHKLTEVLFFCQLFLVFMSAIIFVDVILFTHKIHCKNCSISGVLVFKDVSSSVGVLGRLYKLFWCSDVLAGCFIAAAGPIDV